MSKTAEPDLSELDQYMPVSKKKSRCPVSVARERFSEDEVAVLDRAVEKRPPKAVAGWLTAHGVPATTQAISSHLQDTCTCVGR